MVLCMLFISACKKDWQREKRSLKRITAIFFFLEPLRIGGAVRVGMDVRPIDQDRKDTRTLK